LGQELVIKKKVAEIKTPEQKSIKGAHTVEAGETLYAVARRYNVSVQQLRDWNSLTKDEVKVGQILFVAQPMNTQQVVTTPEVQTKPIVVEPVKTEVKTEVKQPEVKETIKISERVAGSDEIKEGGLAELIEGTDGNRKYLALHRTAKVGTILKVRNELNNREVFVRVAGPLPDVASNNNVVIKISKSAYDRLGAIDPRFRVEVTYYK